MAEKTYTWHRISDSEQSPVTENELREVVAGSKRICVTRWNGKLYAFTSKCPHAGGRLSEGKMDAQGNITCPIHRYRYHVTNGYNTSGEGYYLTTFPVEEREDGIYVGFVKSGGLWGMFKK